MCDISTQPDVVPLRGQSKETFTHRAMRAEHLFIYRRPRQWTTYARENFGSIVVVHLTRTHISAAEFILFAAAAARRTAFAF